MVALQDIPSDKLSHFIAGLLIYALLHFISPVVGLLVVAVAAIGKEGYDYMNRGKHTPDVWDALATMLGGLAGFISGI